MIPYGRQEITPADVEAVVAVLRSDFLTQGPAVPRFEQAVSALVSVPHAVAANSATSALHLACLALDLGPGDRLWTVPNTFVASANCGRYCGAEVDFVDIDPLTWNLSVTHLEEKLVRAKKEARLPKVVVSVHFAGQPTEQERIAALADEYGFRVIEDASHSIGASRNGEPVGSCRWSDITVFSFHPVKIITTGEGGMAVTRHAHLAERMAALRTHGITRRPESFQNRAHADGAGSFPGWYHEQQLLGFNYRMTDMQAALGTSQLQRLEAYVESRNALARRYDDGLKDLPLQLPTTTEGNRSAFHLYVVRLKGEGAAGRRRKIFDALRAGGIGVIVHYIPVHLQPYYRAFGFTEGQFPEAEAFGGDALTLPLYPTLPPEQQDHVISTLGALL